MSDLSRVPATRRADARRSIAAILDAAVAVLQERPGASLAQIAQIAGVSRQTIYAHFGSREELLEALADRAAQRLHEAMDAADLDTGPALAAVLRMFEMAWQTFEAEPFLLAVPSAHAQRAGHRHAPVVDRLTRILARGRDEGDIDPSLPPTWLTSAALALGHAAGEDVRDGRLAPSQALAALRLTIDKAFRANDHDNETHHARID